MPYVSQKQQAFFHTDTARKAGITPAMTKEYDQASKGLKLPKRVPESHPAHAHAGAAIQNHSHA